MYLIATVLLFISSPFGSDDNAIKEIHENFERATFYYEVHNLDSVKLLAQTTLQASQKNRYPYGKGRSLFFLGSVADKENKPSMAVPILLQALEHLGEVDTKKSLFYQAEICITLGKIFRRNYNIPEALNFYDLGIEAAIVGNNKSAHRSLLYNKSVAYRRKGDLEKSIDALTQSLEFLPEGNKVLKQRTYNQFGLIHKELKEYDNARGWYKKIILLDSIENSRYTGQACHNIAVTFWEQKLYTKTWEYYKKALISFENYGIPKDLFLTYLDMSELALLEKRKGTALNYAKEALALIDQVPKMPENYNLYLILSECIQDVDPSKALSYAKQYISETESFHTRQKELLDEEKQYRVKLAAMSYEKRTLSEKYEHRMLIGSIIIGISIILMAIGLFKMLQNPMKYRYSVFQRHMKKLKKEEAERLALEHKKSTEKHAKDLEETRRLLKK